MAAAGARMGGARGGGRCEAGQGQAPSEEAPVPADPGRGVLGGLAAGTRRRPESRGWRLELGPPARVSPRPACEAAVAPLVTPAVVSEAAPRTVFHAAVALRGGLPRSRGEESVKRLARWPRTERATSTTRAAAATFEHCRRLSRARRGAGATGEGWGRQEGTPKLPAELAASTVAGRTEAGLRGFGAAQHARAATFGRIDGATGSGATPGSARGSSGGRGAALQRPPSGAPSW